MKIALLLGMALATVALPSLALADDPNDPTMRSSAARARDREAIRQLNLREAARVRERDARYAEGWSNSQSYSAPRYESSDSSYARSRAQYERELAAWRHAVRACQAGDYDYCAR
ncbi:hypothetical protein [Novosphingobium rosa]|uniref:hypothetical protein n=1 Tax=Novosphingobium rosa TaxID=76978 RepID=UPI00082BC8B8|nr:hypothetical protein [Novosphingobium rosa]